VRQEIVSRPTGSVHFRGERRVEPFAAASAASNPLPRGLFAVVAARPGGRKAFLEVET
jgi:hypothetical protein